MAPVDTRTLHQFSKAVDAGRIVLSDRSYVSTVAYQGARGLDAKQILADSEAEFERPDLALVFTLDPEAGLARVAARGGASEPVFENLPFQKRVAAAFAALRVDGLLRTMFDPRNNLSNQVSQQLVKHFGGQVYSTVIPRNVRLAEAPSHGLPALLYDKNSSGALAYLALAGEMLRRYEKRDIA